MEHVRLGDSHVDLPSARVQRVTNSPADSIASSLEAKDAEPARATPAPCGRVASNELDTSGSRASGGVNDGRRTTEEPTAPGNRISSGGSKAAVTQRGASTYAQ